MKDRYDYAVYGSSAAAMTFAAEKAMQGKKVIMFSKAGYPGGSMTSGLNCLQHLPEDCKDTITGRLISMLETDRHGFFFRKDNTAVINPEALKHAMLKILEDCRASLLFHVTPYAVEIHDNQYCVNLSGREGTIKITAMHLKDASEDHSLIDLIASTELGVDRRLYNIFIYPLKDESILEAAPVVKSVRLGDGRYWVSLDTGEVSPVFSETAAQEILDEFSELLRANGSAVQLLPANSCAVTQIRYIRNDMKRLLLNAEQSGRQYMPEEQFIKALDQEKFR